MVDGRGGNGESPGALQSRAVIPVFTVIPARTVAPDRIITPAFTVIPAQSGIQAPLAGGIQPLWQL